MPDDTWIDAAGATPEDGDGWDWDEESLTMGSYVGYNLYRSLRNRLTTTDVPVAAHNSIIKELIDCHDVSLLTAGAGQATLVVYNRKGSDVIPMIIMDRSEFPDSLKG